MFATAGNYIYTCMRVCVCVWVWVKATRDSSRGTQVIVGHAVAAGTSGNHK